MKNKIMFFTILTTISLSYFVLAQEIGDFQVGGLELDKLLNFGSGLLATALFIPTLLAYKRSKSKRLIYISIAFFLFAIKSFLTSQELFFQEWLWVDPVASIMNFAIMLTFFFGVIKK